MIHIEPKSFLVRALLCWLCYICFLKTYVGINIDEYSMFPLLVITGKTYFLCTHQKQYETSWHKKNYILKNSQAFVDLVYFQHISCFFAHPSHFIFTSAKQVI